MCCFRNYVIQRVLKLQDPGLTDIICFALKGNYVYLSRQKYSSHVLQNCLMTSGMNYALEEFANFDKLWQIARDPYGNYVLKTALQVAEVKYFHIYIYIGYRIFDWCCDRSLSAEHRQSILWEAPEEARPRQGKIPEWLWKECLFQGSQ